MLRTQWSVGLRVIQMKKNMTYHTGLGMTPYEATFGVKPRLGVSGYFPPNFLAKDKIYPEEEIEEFLQQNSSQETSITQDETSEEHSVSQQPSLGTVVEKNYLK